MPGFRALFLAALALIAAEAQAFEKLFCHDKAKDGDYKLNDFHTDGCSGWMQGGGSVGLVNDLYYGHCCIVHDIAYWTGGTEADREAADSALSSCVYNATEGNQVTATMMYVGVRKGGKQCIGTNWRWGYGWVVQKGGRSYKSDRKASALTQKEQQQRLANLEAAKGIARQRNGEVFWKWCKKVQPKGNKCSQATLDQSNKALNTLLGQIRK